MWFDLRTVVFSRRERQLLWKRTSDALAAFLVPLKSSSPPRGTPVAADTNSRAQQERAQNRCSGFLRSVWSGNRLGCAPPRKQGCTWELSCPPHTAGTGSWVLAHAVLAHTWTPGGLFPEQTQPLGVRHTTQNITLNQRYASQIETHGFKCCSAGDWTE